MVANPAKPTVVLVHGAFADASGFAGIIRELQSADCAVYAPPNPERGLAFDAGTLKPFVAAIDGPVVLVGHSYGGAVITQASASLSNVVGLVYLAGFGLDTGESVAAVQAPFAPPLLAANGRATSYDAVGAAGGPDLYIDGKTFRETFCADLPVDVAAVMAVSQRPVAAATLNENCTAPAGNPFPPGIWCPPRITPSIPTPSASWPSAWEPPPIPCRAPTSPSSAIRSRPPPSSCRA
jgi:pimeloyl-ACP methyl ester carboxylesterase